MKKVNLLESSRMIIVLAFIFPAAVAKNGGNSYMDNYPVDDYLLADYHAPLPPIDQGDRDFKHHYYRHRISCGRAMGTAASDYVVCYRGKCIGSCERDSWDWGPGPWILKAILPDRWCASGEWEDPTANLDAPDPECRGITCYCNCQGLFRTKCTTDLNSLLPG